MTRNDLLKGNEDLLNRAGKILAVRKPRAFNVSLSALGQTMSIELTTLNVQSVDVYVDDRPATTSTAVLDGTQTIDIPLPGAGARLRIEGFDQGTLVAARKIQLA